MRDPYSVLGLSQKADAKEIKSAFRKLAKENHPDRHPDDDGAQSRFAEINTAYEILGDKDKRGQYDRGEIDEEGKPKFQGFEGFGGGNGGRAGGFENVDPSAFADMFSGFGFGGNRGAGGGGGRNRTFRFTQGGPGGQSFEGSGATEEEILRSILGEQAGHPGAGARRPAKKRGADVKANVAVTLEDLAAKRKPKVQLPTGKTIALTMPAGVTDGQTIRLKGQGQAGQAGGTAGDALVTVKFVPHPLFKADGSNLKIDLPVSLDEAVLGAKVAVPTLSGRVQITVPANSSSGKTLRLKGKGLPKKTGTGDLMVALKIMLPETDDEDLKSLMERWREEKRPGPRDSEFK